MCEISDPVLWLLTSLLVTQTQPAGMDLWIDTNNAPFWLLGWYEKTFNKDVLSSTKDDADDVLLCSQEL